MLWARRFPSRHDPGLEIRVTDIHPNQAQQWSVFVLIAVLQPRPAAGLHWLGQHTAALTEPLCALVASR